MVVFDTSDGPRNLPHEHAKRAGPPAFHPAPRGLLAGPGGGDAAKLEARRDVCRVLLLQALRLAVRGGLDYRIGVDAPPTGALMGAFPVRPVPAERMKLPA